MLLNSVKKYYNSHVLFALFFGFVNGFMLQIPWVTVNYWLSSENVNLKSIGLFSAASLPYALKYVIAIFIDRNNLNISKYINADKFWLIFSGVMAAIFIFFLSYISINNNLTMIAFVCLCIAFFSTIIDIVSNIIRINMNQDSFKYQANSLYTVGYRIGMLFTAAGAIYLSYYCSWDLIFKYISFFSLFFVLIFILMPNFTYQSHNIEKISLKSTNVFYRLFVEPFKHLGKWSHFVWIIIFLALYKTADYMLVVMLQPLLLELSYNAIEISTAGKFFGFACSLVGGIIAGFTMPFLSIKKSLLIFGIIHILSFLSLFPLYHAGHNINFLYIFTALEATTSGMTMTAYISYITSLCKGKYKGTQYAVFFSIMGFSRTIFPMLSGYLVKFFGWSYFFLIIIIIASISLPVIKKIQE